MQLVMAVSADGYVARGPSDTMGWLGAWDKKAFRLLTACGKGVCVTSRETARLMPAYLEGRTLMTTSRHGVSRRDLSYMSKRYPGCSLLGGQTLAMAALRQGLLHTIHLCRSEYLAKPEEHPEAVRDDLTPYLLFEQGGGRWSMVMRTRLVDTEVETWRIRQ